MDYVRPSGHFEQGREEAYFLRRKPSVIDRAQGTGHRAQGTKTSLAGLAGLASLAGLLQ